jgi:hypothetical protein
LKEVLKTEGVPENGRVIDITITAVDEDVELDVSKNAAITVFPGSPCSNLCHSNSSSGLPNSLHLRDQQEQFTIENGTYISGPFVMVLDKWFDVSRPSGVKS